MGIFSSEDDGAGRATDRVGHAAFAKQHAFYCEAVDVWCRGNLSKRSAVCADRLGGVVVAKNEENVRICLFRKERG